MLQLKFCLLTNNYHKNGESSHIINLWLHVGSCTSKIIMLTIFLNNRITELLFANLYERHKVESKVVERTILILTGLLQHVFELSSQWTKCSHVVLFMSCKVVLKPWPKRVTSRQLATPLGYDL